MVNPSPNKPVDTPRTHSRWNRLYRQLFEPVDASSLGALRMLLGAIMVWQVYKAWPTIAQLFITPNLNFKYGLFPFVTAWPGNGMYIHFAVMGVAAAGLLLGLCYRFCAIVYFGCFTYYFLLEEAIYLNHYYMVCLLSFLMIFLQADRWGALDMLWRGKLKSAGTVPFWNVLLLRGQLIIVYFFGGIAKINGDWLRGEPMTHFAKSGADLPGVGRVLAHDWTGLYLFSYGGLIFDLAIGFLLLYRRTRVLALIPLAFFHLANAFMFNIGIFPWLMLGATIIFFDPGLPRSVWDWAVAKRPEPVAQQAGQQESADTGFGASAAMTLKSKLVVSFLVVWFAVQLLVPFRHWLYPGNVSWTEQGHRFSWHMMLRKKKGWLTFAVTDPQTGKTVPVTPMKGYVPDGLELTHRQLLKMATRPYLIIQYAHFLREHAHLLGIEYPIIRVFSLVTLNGRPHQYMIDPEANLAEAEYPLFSAASWIVPLKEDQPIGVYEKLDLRRFDEDLLRRFPDNRFWRRYK